MKNRKIVFRQGMRDGLPIGLGYFAVSFSLGIAMARVGLTPVQAFLTSLLCNASAGEYAGVSLIGAGAALIEVALMTFIANARYMLMSCALGQRMHPKTKFWHRLLIGFDVTDEIFAITIAREGHLDPLYTYGAMLVSIPCWATGTALGVIAGDIMPLRLTSALSVALFGMFLAVFIPPAKKDKVIAGLIVLCFTLSAACTYLPAVREIPEGTRTILLTVLIAGAAAALFPRKEVQSHE